MSQDIGLLKGRLRLIEVIALSHIDGDNMPNDTVWSEIAGIAGGDWNVIHCARVAWGFRAARPVAHKHTSHGLGKVGGE